MDHKPRADAVPGAQIDGRVRCRGICRDVSPTNEAPEGLVDEDAPTYEGRHAGYPMTTKKFPGQLPTDCGPLPRLLYSVDDVAEMFGRAPSTIRAACWVRRSNSSYRR